MSEQPAPYDGMRRADPTARLQRQEAIERLLEEALDALVQQLPLSPAAALRAETKVREARRLLARL